MSDPDPIFAGFSPEFRAEQARAEARFMVVMAAEQARMAQEAALPDGFSPSARPGRWARALMRALPPLARLWQLRILRESGLFVPDWYRSQNPDLAPEEDPARHYLRIGGAEGRAPGPWFDGAHYLRLYPDVAASGINPLIHFLTDGWREGRSAHPRMPERRV
ncbi:MAG: hypothetical protein ACK5M4_03340 [Pseudorhodobacter sp.]